MVTHRRGHSSLADLARDIGEARTPSDDEQAAWSRVIRDPATSPEAREAAIGEMMRRNLPLVLHLARVLARRGEELGDLVGYGVIGLRRACERFDPDAGGFGPYAALWIRQAIGLGRLELAAGRPCRIPYYLANRHRRASRLRRRLAAGGEAVSLADAARRLGFDREAPYLGRVESKTVQGGDDEGRRPVEGVPDARGEGADPAEAAEAVELLDRLDDRERRVMRLWYGLDPIPGLEDAPLCTANRPTALIARHLGLTRERVRQLHVAALARLRGWAAGAP